MSSLFEPAQRCRFGTCSFTVDLRDERNILSFDYVFHLFSNCISFSVSFLRSYLQSLDGPNLAPNGSGYFFSSMGQAWRRIAPNSFLELFAIGLASFHRARGRNNPVHPFIHRSINERILGLVFDF